MFGQVFTPLASRLCTFPFLNAHKMSEEHFDVISGMFAERVSNPLAWFKHSRSLLAAARSTRERASVLIDPWEKIDLEHVATMLYGFCIENLFKAIWTLRKFGPPYRDEWSPVAAFPVELKTHDLVRLAKLIDEDLFEKYELSLSLLSEAATWSGRYPCSLKGDEGSIFRMPQVSDDAEAIFKQYSRPFTTIS